MNYEADLLGNAFDFDSGDVRERGQWHVTGRYAAPYQNPGGNLDTLAYQNSEANGNPNPNGDTRHGL